jgi:hypothetical protein
MLINLSPSRRFSIKSLWLIIQQPTVNPTIAYRVRPHLVSHIASVVAAFNTVRACLKSSLGSDIDKIVAQ